MSEVLDAVDLDLADMQAWFHRLCGKLPPRVVLGLVGTLGAGKTTAVQTIAQWLGLDPSDVTSPTFTLMNQYKITCKAPPRGGVNPGAESSAESGAESGVDSRVNTGAANPVLPPVMNHLDAYRLADEDEFLELGVDELFDADGWTIVEWADRVRDVMPNDTVWIHLTVQPDDRRSITVSGWPSSMMESS